MGHLCREGVAVVVGGGVLEGAKCRRFHGRSWRPFFGRGHPCADTIVRVAADHDGVVPGHFGEGAIVEVVADHDGAVPGWPDGGAVVRVAADDDGVVPGCPGGGAPQLLAWS